MGEETVWDEKKESKKKKIVIKSAKLNEPRPDIWANQWGIKSQLDPLQNVSPGFQELKIDIAETKHELKDTSEVQ